MKKEKNLVQDAIEDINLFLEATKSNTKEILRSTMKDEIDELLKEHLLNEENKDDDDTDETEMDKVLDNQNNSDDLNDDLDDEEEVETDDDDIELDLDDEEELETDDDDIELDMDDEEELETDDDDIELDMDDEEELETDDDDIELDMDDDDDIELDMDDEEEFETDDETLDLRNANNNTLINVFKKLNDDDEIEIVSDDEVKLKTDEDEYLIKLNDMFDSKDNIDDFDEDPIYEVTLDEQYLKENENNTNDDFYSNYEPIDLDKYPPLDLGDNNSGQEINVDNDDNDTIEEIKHLKGLHNRSLARTKHPNRELNKYKAKYKKVLKTAQALQEQNKQIKVALNKFKKTLAETVLYNTNLTYMVKLMTENTVSKDEKLSIMKRFDSVKTLEESKRLYNTILHEVKNNKKSINEAVSKINKVNGSSKSTLTETTVYEDESIKKIKDLMKKIEKK